MLNRSLVFGCGVSLWLWSCWMLSVRLSWRPACCSQHTTGIICWAEAPIKIARMTLTIKLDRNWSSFQLANSAPPLSVTDSAIAPSARMQEACALSQRLSWGRKRVLLSNPCVWQTYSAAIPEPVTLVRLLSEGHVMLPRRVRCTQQCAMLGQRVWAFEQALLTPPRKK